MTAVGRPFPRPPRALVAAGLAMVGVLLVAASVSPAGADDAVPLAEAAPATVLAPASPTPASPTSEAPPAGSSRARSSTDRSAVRDRTVGLVLPESDPVSVSIPAIDVRSRLERLGVDGDGALEVPRDPDEAGWFTEGAAPGALGPAVLAGHVTWNGRDGVFRRLGHLHRGDRVAVAREDGRTAVFTVERVARFSKSRFPTDEVYGTIDHAGLRLITCGGTYDAAHHRYLDNVVVFARLTRIRG